jgi:hypothetical protein
VLLGDSADVASHTFSFQEHEETMGLLIGSGYGQRAAWADDLVSLEIKL